MYKFLIRPLVFLLDAETAHHFSFRAIKILSKLGLSGLFRKAFAINDPLLEREVFGLKFKNPVGLAAGFDKDAKLYNELSDFGFGFVEIGTLTPKPQDGNPKKRLFRLLDDEAIINRMGFNNKGVFEAVEQLKKKHRVLIGGNIGKNKLTPNENAIKDYLICFEALFEYVDYFVVNVSSPNTPGLRELQDKEPLTNLLKKLKRQNGKLAKKRAVKEKPILLKIAPDLTDDQLLDIVSIMADTAIDGIIATNTTISRKGLKSHLIISEEKGGLSGKPLAKRSTEVIRFLAEKSNKAFPIIGVGGIHSAEDALEKLDAGADLIQLYTGFVYEGPSLVKKINQAILTKAHLIPNNEKYSLHLGPFIVYSGNGCSNPKSTQNGFYQNVSSCLVRSRKTLFRIANAMPEELYGYRPTPESKTFAEQLVHIGYTVELLTKRYVQGMEVKPNTPDASTMSKQEILQLLKNGFAYTTEVIYAVEQSKLDETCVMYHSGNTVSRAFAFSMYRTIYQSQS